MNKDDHVAGVRAAPSVAHRLAMAFVGFGSPWRARRTRPGLLAAAGRVHTTATMRGRRCTPGRTYMQHRENRGGG